VTTEVVPQSRVLRQALLLWAVAFAAIVAVSFLTPPPWAKVTAVVAFLYLPLAAMRGSGEDARDYGVTLARWRTDVLLAVLLFAAVAPLFVLGYRTWLGHLLVHELVQFSGHYFFVGPMIERAIYAAILLGSGVLLAFSGAKLLELAGSRRSVATP